MLPLTVAPRRSSLAITPKEGRYQIEGRSARLQRYVPEEPERQRMSFFEEGAYFFKACV